MIRSLEIKGFRGFKRFEMSGLGRINLLVGTNNSGKTSVLEALYLLAAGGDPRALWQIVNRRGERLDYERDPRRPVREMDISHLFHGHEIRPGATFSLSAENEDFHQSITYAIGEAPRRQPQESSGPEAEELFGTRLALHITGTPKPAISRIPLTHRTGVSAESFDFPRSARRSANGESITAQYVATESLSRDQLTRMWGKIALTPAEDRVLRALQFLDPQIERIAGIPTWPEDMYYPSLSRGGFVVKERNSEQPVPIGSLGDGMWRVLSLAVALSRSKDGLVLIDEIDTGLHYTVMTDMWKLVSETARELNVQVFATTHSYDCIHSLASICRADVQTNSQVTIQRIEPDRQKAVPYTEAEIKVAAERHIEVR